MRDLKRIRLLGTFDREPFISLTLRVGLLISLACILGGAGWQAVIGSLQDLTHIQGTNVVGLLLTEFAQGISLTPNMFIHLGIAALLLTPYVRILASCWYFAMIEHDRRYALFTGVISAMLTYLLFMS